VSYAKRCERGERGGAWWSDVTTLFRRKALSFSCLGRREG
jgi:hypothetical protein